MKKKNIMIFGGQFYNKGAQAMSFHTISRLKNKFPNHRIIFVSAMDSLRPNSEIENYNFDIITNPFDRNNILGENLLRKVMGKLEKPNPKNVKPLLEETEFIFDISGYALSSQWGVKASRNYLKRFKLANKYGIKTFILPQSIGPFNYENDREIMIKELHDVLSTVDIIMPREPQGEEALKKIGLYENVKQIPDLVLTDKESINWKHIYKSEYREKQFNILPDSVAIVPNMKNFTHGEKEWVLELYKEAIQYLLKVNKNVYLTRHSHEDIQACYEIKEMFPDEPAVQLIVEDLSPTEFELMIEQVDFSIGSRFHSVVHSFKLGTPNIILGWAIKYKELAKLFGQQEYVIDVRDNPSAHEFIGKIQMLNEKHESESKIIKRSLDKLYKFEDPFDYIFDKFNL